MNRANVDTFEKISGQLLSIYEAKVRKQTFITE